MFLQVSVILFTGGAWSWGVWSRGCAFPGGGVSGPGRGAYWRPPTTATAAGGTHPTGMHSCRKLFHVFNVIYFKFDTYTL